MKLIEPPDDGQKHFPGCWAEDGHHECARRIILAVGADMLVGALTVQHGIIGKLSQRLAAAEREGGRMRARLTRHRVPR